jgi:hypothetical protein
MNIPSQHGPRTAQALEELLFAGGSLNRKLLGAAIAGPDDQVGPSCE